MAREKSAMLRDDPKTFFKAASIFRDGYLLSSRTDRIVCQIRWMEGIQARGSEATRRGRNTARARALEVAIQSFTDQPFTPSPQILIAPIRGWDLTRSQVTGNKLTGTSAKQNVKIALHGVRQSHSGLEFLEKSKRDARSCSASVNAQHTDRCCVWLESNSDAVTST